MWFQDRLYDLQDAVSPFFGILERDPVLRWSVIGLFWLLFMLRAFGRTTGQHRGPFNWYDWLVIVVGTAVIWIFQFGGSISW